MKPKHWLVFILLGVVWSSSFLWIKIALQEIGPFTLVGFRVFFGLVAMLAIAAFARSQWPRERATWLMLMLLGITNTAVPFVLISWGEIYIESAVASILNSTTPLFTILIAHYFLYDDKMSLPKVLGLILGFVGVLLLLSKDLIAASHNSVLGQAAVLIASLFYAGSSVFARRTTQDTPASIRVAIPFLAVNLVVWPLAPISDGVRFAMPQLPITWVALLWLGLLGSCAALLMWYYLLHEIGPTRTTLVTYIFPLGGVILGVIFLHESLSWQLAVGALLIISSIAVVNWVPKKREMSNELLNTEN